MNTFISPSSERLQYCEVCAGEKTKKESTKNFCEWKEKNCKSKAKASGYCGKHEPRATLLQKAIESGVRICDDGKRYCKNTTVNGKLKCKECLEGTRKKEKNQYIERKELLKCLTCGIDLQDFFTGLRGHKIQKFQGCYDKWRNIEEIRIRNRNYSCEKRQNLAVAHRAHQDTASKRGLISLDYDIYCDIVTKPCTYCGKYNELEVVGIDRINSEKGYTPENCTSCCEDCNRAKGTLSYEEFKNFILRVALVLTSKSKEEESTIVKNSEVIEDAKSRIRPHKIYEYYIRKKFQTFIEYCKEDNRSPSFIQKMQAIQNLSTPLNSTEFKRQLRNALFIEERSLRSTVNGERKRIPRKELFGLFESKNSNAAINLYNRVFGEDKENTEDMMMLGEKWETFESETTKQEELERILIKFQNRRNKIPQSKII
jgi:hypothetical protein